MTLLPTVHNVLPSTVSLTVGGSVTIVKEDFYFSPHSSPLSLSLVSNFPPLIINFNALLFIHSLQNSDRSSLDSSMPRSSGGLTHLGLLNLLATNQLNNHLASQSQTILLFSRILETGARDSLISFPSPSLHLQSP